MPPEDAKTKDVSAREAIEAIRGPMSNAELMQKFMLKPQGFADLLRQLFLHKLITEEDLQKRGARYKPGKKEPEPAAAAPPPPPAPAPVPVTAHMDDEDYSFLDTVTLTDLLTLKPLDAPPPLKKKPEVPAPTDEQEETPESKKKKFRLGGLFRKD
jgi:hypothetical protein